MADRIRARLTFANCVSLVALFVALGGTSYAVATGSIDSREIKNNTVRSKDLRNNTVRSKDLRNNTVRSKDLRNNTVHGKDIRNGTVRSRDVGNSSLLAEDFAPGQLPQGAQGPQGPAGVVGNLTVQRLDLPLNDGTNNSGSVPCPAGEKIIAGSVNVSDATSADVNITVSRPSQGAGQLVPDSGEAFDRWRGAAVNPAAGTGNVTLRVWAICTPGTQQSVPGTGPGGD
jgi:hypothetical protein